ncbi:hypothetical protein V8C42DRAFT_338993 [Trichoderma barbatum]
MNSPSTTISTEEVTTSLLAEAFTEELQKGLYAAAKSREETTPEPTYSTDNFEQPFRYLAELQRKHYTPREAEKIRQRIPNLEYWKREAQCFEAVVNEIRERALKMEDWKKLAKGYKSLLTHIGSPAYEFEQLRFSISGESYWNHELEFFKQESNRREYELKMKWKQDHQRQMRVGHRSVQTRQPRLTSLAQTADQVSSRTRSKTQSGGVAKRVSRNNTTRGR